jgi:clan AA aspartic protease
MIVGEVTSQQEAFVRVVVEGPRETRREVDAVLDTGFNGALTLPSPPIDTLDLAQRGDTMVQLASGEQRRVLTYRAVVVFGEERQTITIAEASEPLVGMRLLWGNALRIECKEGGTVMLEAF